MTSLSGMAATSDRELVAAVLNGQLDAFATLVGRYRDVRTRFAMRMLGGYDAADDALQASFVRAFQSLSRCKEPDRFGDWLFRIVINECRARAMRRSVRERATGEFPVIRSIPAPSSDPAAEIQRALDQVDPINREPFVLQYIEELSYPQIAALTGVNIPTLEAQVDRACARMRELLGKMYAEHRQAVARAEADAHDPGPPFIVRIAMPLRRPEVLNESFEDRLMSKLLRPGEGADDAKATESKAPVIAVGATSGVSTPTTAPATRVDGPGVSHRRAARVAGGVALASVAFASGYLVHGRGGGSPARPQVAAPVVRAPTVIRRTDTVRVVRTDTIQLARFVFVDDAARSVSVVGDFNEWNVKASPMLRGSNGYWAAAVPVRPGGHEYAFVVDGKRWVTDRTGAVRWDQFGVQTSILSATATPLLDAQGSGSNRLQKALPRPVAKQVLATIADARARGLPASPLENQVLKFAAKGVPSAQIDRAIADHAARLASAQRILSSARGREPLGTEVEAGAEALRVGLDAGAVAALAKAAGPDRSLEIPLTAAALLGALDGAETEGLARLEERLTNGATDAALERLALEATTRSATQAEGRGKALAATKSASRTGVIQAGAPAKAKGDTHTTSKSSKRAPTAPATRP